MAEDLTSKAQQYDRARQAARKVSWANALFGALQGAAGAQGIQIGGAGIDPSTYAVPQLSQQERWEMRMGQGGVEDRLKAIAESLAVIDNERYSAREKLAARQDAGLEQARLLLDRILQESAENQRKAGEEWGKGERTQWQSEWDTYSALARPDQLVWLTSGQAIDPDSSDKYQTQHGRTVVGRNVVPTTVDLKRIDDLLQWAGGDSPSANLDEIVDPLAKLATPQLAATMKENEALRRTVNEIVEYAERGGEGDIPASLPVGSSQEALAAAKEISAVMRGHYESNKAREEDNKAARERLDELRTRVISGSSTETGIPEEWKPLVNELMLRVASGGSYAPSMETMMKIEAKLAGRSDEEIAAVLEGLKEEAAATQELGALDKDAFGREQILRAQHDRMLELLEQLDQPNPPANIIALRDQIMGQEGFPTYMEEEGLTHPGTAFQHLIRTSRDKMLQARTQDQTKLKADAVAGVGGPADAVPKAASKDQPGVAITYSGGPKPDPFAKLKERAKVVKEEALWESGTAPV